MKIQIEGKNIKLKNYIISMALLLLIIISNASLVLGGLLIRFNIDHSLTLLIFDAVVGLFLPVLAFWTWCSLIKSTSKSNDANAEK